jgi:uncharacterized protein YjbI with pentapeptide repeats
MDNLNEEAIKLILDKRIPEFNKFRLHNLTFKPNLSYQDFSGKNLSLAFLNGAICIQTNFPNCILKKTNLVQAELNNSNFENADLTDTLFMYAEMKNCNLRNCNMKRSNFMWTNLQNSDLSGSKITNTNFIEANLQSAILKDFNKEHAFMKYAKLELTE